MRTVRILFACLALFVCAVPSAHAFPHGNPATWLLAMPVDPERYDFARHCSRRPTRGALALEAWLERKVRDSWFSGAEGMGPYSVCERKHVCLTRSPTGTTFTWISTCEGRACRRASGGAG